MFNECIKYNYQVIALIELINNHIIDFSTVPFCYQTRIFLMVLFSVAFFALYSICDYFQPASLLWMEYLFP